MSKPKLSTKTPDATESNALIELHGNLISMPRERRLIVAEVIVKSVATDVASGEQQATLQLAHIEVPVGQHRADLEAIIDAAFKSRTNLTHRPDPTAEVGTPLEGLGEGDLDDGVE